MVIEKEQIICHRNTILILAFVCQTVQPSEGIFNGCYLYSVLLKQHFEPFFVKDFLALSLSLSPYICINFTSPSANISTLLISTAVATYSGSFKAHQCNDPVVTSMNEELNKPPHELGFILYQ